VETFLGGGTVPLSDDVIAEGLGTATSPGRLQLVGTEPTVIVDAAHNPHGAQSLVRALREAFDFDEWGLVLGVFADKDAAGIVNALAPIAARVFATAPESDRAEDPERIADLVERLDIPVSVHPGIDDAAREARAWASQSDRRAVVIAGSVFLAGEAITLSVDEEWKA